MINGHPATASPPGFGYEVDRPAETNGDDILRSQQGVGLHWHWGSRSTSSYSSPPEEEADAEQDAVRSPRSRSPPLSRSLAQTLGTSSPPRSGNNSDDSGSSPRSGSVSPPNPPTPPKYHSAKYSAPFYSPKSGSPPTSGSSTPLNNDSLYKEFVKKWCFAQSPSPGTGGGPILSGGLSPPGLSVV